MPLSWSIDSTMPSKLSKRAFANLNLVAFLEINLDARRFFGLFNFLHHFRNVGITQSPSGAPRCRRNRRLRGFPDNKPGALRHFALLVGFHFHKDVTGVKLALMHRLLIAAYPLDPFNRTSILPMTSVRPAALTFCVSTSLTCISLFDATLSTYHFIKNP